MLTRSAKRALDAAKAAKAEQEAAVKRTPPPPEPAEDKENQCPICLGQLEEKKVLHCGHVFCYDCFKNWSETQLANGLQRNCALCRAVLAPEDEEEEEELGEEFWFLRDTQNDPFYAAFEWLKSKLDHSVLELLRVSLAPERRVIFRAHRIPMAVHDVVYDHY